MARDQVDMTPINSRDELVAWFEAGCKPKSEFRVGTEHEKFVFTADGHRPVPYGGPRGIRALLDGMQHLLGWEPIMEGENIIGLADVTGGGASCRAHRSTACTKLRASCSRISRRCARSRPPSASASSAWA
jgi:glutamate--cysteine ligase